MHYRYHRISLFFISSLLVSSAHAQSGRLFIEAGGALSEPIIYSVGEKRDATFQYDPIRDTSRSGFFNLKVGYRWSLDVPIFTYYSLALEYGYATKSHIKSGIRMNNSSTVTHEGEFDLQYQTLMMISKVTLVNHQSWMPYLSAGLGIAKNNFSNYQEHASTTTPRINPAFAGGRRTVVAGSFGAGVDYSLNETIWLSLGYRYSHLGRFESGVSTANQFGAAYHPMTGRLHSQHVNFSIRYFI